MTCLLTVPECTYLEELAHSCIGLEEEKYEAGDYTISELVKLGVILVRLYINHFEVFSVSKKNKIKFRRNGTFALFVRRNGIRRNGMTPSGPHCEGW